MDYLFLAISITCFSIQFLFSKYYQRATPSGLYSGLYFSMIYGIVLTLPFLVASNFKVEVRPTALIWAIVFALSNVLIVVCSILALGKGSVGQVVMFTYGGGLILPVLAGVLIWNETFGIMKAIGSILVLTAFVVLNRKDAKSKTNKSDKPNKSFLFLCIIIFITNGLIGISIKAHQILEDALTTNNFLFLSYLMIAISAFILLIVTKSKESSVSRPKIKYIVILSIVAFSIVNGIGNFSAFQAAITLDSTLQFPISSSAIVLLTPFLALLFYKEKIKKNDALALIINTAGIICFLFT